MSCTCISDSESPSACSEMKEKPESTRTFDEDGYRRRAACLCFRDNTEKEILLVTSSQSLEYWIIPGGGVDPMEDFSTAAIREVHEEAGVRGQLVRHLGFFQNDAKKQRTSVYVFLVEELLDQWDDAKRLGRKRKWFCLTEVESLLAYSPAQMGYLQLYWKASPTAHHLALGGSQGGVPNSQLPPQGSNCAVTPTPVHGTEEGASLAQSQ